MSPPDARRFFRGCLRSYDYSNSLEPIPRLRLRIIRDGFGNIIESHEYEAYGSGRAVSSFGPGGEIESIAGAPGRPQPG